MLEGDKFHYCSYETTEDISRYAPGGFHPIIMGNILRDPLRADGPGYRIMHKLGWGAFATVWLAQHTETQAWVAVKVTESKTVSSMEAAMLEAVAKSAPVDSPQRNIITLLDSWTFDGPNGQHSVLVAEVAAALSTFHSSQRSPQWRKTVARGLVRAVEQMHGTGAGIVHGDLHLGNVGVAVPQLAQQDIWDVMQDLSYPEVTIVLPTTAEKQTPSLPAYLIMPCNLAEYYNRIETEEPPHTLVFDFGAAHEVGAPPASFQCRADICAPEVAFAVSHENNLNPIVDRTADIWALGACMFEIFADSSLFNVGLLSIPASAATLAGYIPEHWMGCQRFQEIMARRPNVSPAGAEEIWSEKRKWIRPHCMDDADADALIRLVRKILVLDPAMRPSAADVAGDPWFADGPTVS